MNLTPLQNWQLYTSDFESPNSYIEWGFYSLISSAVQRRVWITNTSKLNGLPTQNSIFLNQFVVFVGPPATGKTRVTSNVKAACEHTKNVRVISNPKTGQQVMVLPAISCTPDNITFEGLFEFIAMPDKMDCITIKSISADGKAVETPYAHNSVTACLEELTVMFTKNTEDVASLLCQAYDARGLQRHTKTQGTFNIRNVCVNFLAGTTPKDLRRIINNQTIQQGLSTRVIFVYASEPRFNRYKSENTLEKELAFEALVSHVNQLTTKVHGEISFSADADEFLREKVESMKLMKHERINHDSNLDGYYGRKKLHLQKLAATMHLGEHLDSMTIELPTVERALVFLNQTEVNMHLVFKDTGRNELDEIAKQVAAYLKQYGDTSSRRLIFMFNSACRKIELDEVMLYLEQTGQVNKTQNGYKYNPMNEFKDEGKV